MNGPELIANFPDLERLAAACERAIDFRTHFGTEEACRDWFRRARWPNGFECPRCGASGRWIPSRRVYECRRCRKQTSPTAGTLLHGTRKSFRKWFEAAYLIVQRGVNAKRLQRELGLTYKVAWTWGHKLREALRPHVKPEDPGASDRVVSCYFPTRGGDRSAPREEPCGCTKLLARDWGWPDELEEEREATRRRERFLRGERLPVETVPFDAPPSGDWNAGWDLLATFKGSLSEKHLRRYLDGYAFVANRKRRTVAERFECAARALVTTGPLSYRRIAARAPAEGYPLELVTVKPRRSRREAGAPPSAGVPA